MSDQIVNPNTAPNLGWLFQKDYYLHEEALDKRVFYKIHFDDLTKQIKIKEQQRIQFRSEVTREQNEEKKQKIKEDIKALQREIDVLQGRIDHFFKQKNEGITGREWQFYKEVAELFQCEAANNAGLSMQVGYPGFITGIGIKRGIKDVPDEIKIGFAFDHTTGLPYMPGSGLKGVLRSAFPQRFNASLQEKHVLFAPSRSRFLQQYFTVMGIDLPQKVEAWLKSLSISHTEIEYDLAIDLLEMSIFHCWIPTGFDSKDKPEYAALPISKRDIFFDAFLEHDEWDGPFMATDFITPHLNREKPELSPFTEPVPLQFLKLRPGMKFRFQWRTSDLILTPLEKSALFEYILTTFGIGAKTNTGYGQLT